MKHNVSELSGALLDAAVAKAEGWELHPSRRGWWCKTPVVYHGVAVPMELQPGAHKDESGYCAHGSFNPSGEWRVGGPIIERERIDVFYGTANGAPCWFAKYFGSKRKYHDAIGDTPLIAAMRCYVASKFGEEVEL